MKNKTNSNLTESLQSFSQLSHSLSIRKFTKYPFLGFFPPELVFWFKTHIYHWFMDGPLSSVVFNKHLQIHHPKQKPPVMSLHISNSCLPTTLTESIHYPKFHTHNFLAFLFIQFTCIHFSCFQLNKKGITLQYVKSYFFHLIIRHQDFYPYFGVTL